MKRSASFGARLEIHSGNILAGKALRDICSKSMDGILSQEATLARHTLALACHLAQHNAPQLLDAHSDLATVVAATCGVYEASGELAHIDNSAPWMLNVHVQRLPGLWVSTEVSLEVFSAHDLVCIGCKTYRGVTRTHDRIS